MIQVLYPREAKQQGEFAALLQATAFGMGVVAGWRLEIRSGELAAPIEEMKIDLEEGRVSLVADQNIKKDLEDVQARLDADRKSLEESKTMATTRGAFLQALSPVTGSEDEEEKHKGKEGKEGEKPKNDLIHDLGTTTETDTNAFTRAKTTGGGVPGIGASGVGFHSTSLVPDGLRVDKRNDDDQCIWGSGASGVFTVRKVTEYEDETEAKKGDKGKIMIKEKEGKEGDEPRIEGINDFGAITKSDTEADMKAKTPGGDISGIGHFGVGFRPTNLVLDEARVGKRHDDDQNVWKSGASGSITVQEATELEDEKEEEKGEAASSSAGTRSAKPWPDKWKWCKRWRSRAARPESFAQRWNPTKEQKYRMVE